MADTITITINVPATVTRKIAGHTFTLDFAKAPAETLAWQFLYGTRGLNDAANASKKNVADGGGEWTPADSEAFVNAWLDGTVAERARRASGGSTLDPVTVEARKLAARDVVARLGVKTWKEAATTEKGAKYFKLTDKGNVMALADGLDDYIARHDAKAKDADKLVTRAAAIVNASAADEEVEVDL